MASDGRVFDPSKGMKGIHEGLYVCDGAAIPFLCHEGALACRLDCTLDDVQVGGAVRMSFRKRWYDKDRGYTGYFWKAVPVAEA